jgi:hypothetical protein
MNKATEKLHNQIVAGLGHNDVSPAALAYKMHRESLYVNESLLHYMINYINLMAEAKIIPMHLANVQQVCKTLNGSLQELGLVGEYGRVPHSANELLQL